MAEQTKPETNEIASAATDFDLFQGYLSHLDNPDKVLRLECGGDITVYDDIGRDSRIASGLRTRSLAVIGKEWQIIPFSQESIDIKVAEYVGKVFLGFPFDKVRRSLLRGGTLKGFGVAEVMWGISEGDVWLDDLRYRHQRRFRFDLDGNLLLITVDNPLGQNVTLRDGAPLRKFQTVIFGDESETPYGCGLGRELYWPWWFKKNGLKFWLMYCDKFAGPTVRGEYDTGTSQADQNKLLAAAQAVHSNSAIIHPKGMSLSLLEAARSGSITSYRELVEYMDDEITICLLGQTGTTTGTPGSLGNQDAQADVRADLVKADADALCEAFNARAGGCIRWLVDYQFPGLGRYPQMWIDCDAQEDKLTLAERDDKLTNPMANSGLRLTRSYYVRAHKLEEDDIEAAPAVAQSYSATPGTPSFAEPVGAPLAAPSVLTTQLAQRADAPVTAWVESLRIMTDQAESLEALRDQVLSAFPDMSPDGLAQILAEETLRAAMIGRMEADDGG